VGLVPQAKLVKVWSGAESGGGAHQYSVPENHLNTHP